MKKILFISAVLICSAAFGLSAQSSPYAAIYEKYSQTPGFTTVEITGAMLKLLSGNSGLENPLKGVESIKVISTGNPSRIFVSEIKNIGAGKDYILMSSMTENGTGMMFYYKEKPGGKKNMVSEFVMVTYEGDESGTLISITGDIDVTKISQMSNIKMDGFEGFKLSE